MRLILLVAASLATFSAYAQQTPARFTQEYDSLMQRAARVRTLTDSQLGRFRSNSFAIRGTRHKVISYRVFNNDVHKTNFYQKAKIHVIKHKTTAAEVERVVYLDPRGSVLKEWYQKNQLVRLELQENGISKTPSQSQRQKTTYVRGSYIARKAVAQSGAESKSTTEYFFAPRPGQE